MTLEPVARLRLTKVTIGLALRLTAMPILAATLLVGGFTLADAAHATPPGLTQDGKALWNFEALLRATFGSGLVCVVSKSGLPDFVSKPCQSLPLAGMQPYEFKFAGARRSAYHLVSRRKPPFAGNYPIPVEIAGRYIACNSNATTFLFTNGAQYGFSPGCYPLQPPP
jgi:hypothetical protein